MAISPKNGANAELPENSSNGTDPSKRKAVEFAQHFRASGESEFMAFTPEEFEKQVVLDGLTFQISAKNHIVRVVMVSQSSPNSQERASIVIVR